jgi:halimadienyl-diphosphate synthase
MIDLKNEAINLLKSLDLGYMGGMAYDTAWIAKVPLSKENNKPLFPQTLLWLFTNQKDDGSWGANYEYFHDRIISTLASIITLSQTHSSEKFKENILKGESYIWYNIRNLRGGEHETVAFELLFPSLMKEAEQLGLNLPFHEKLYSEEREKKLILGYSDLLSKRASTITYSIEHLGSSSKIDNISAIQSENGSIGNSPAATAFILTQGYDQWAYNYIQKVLRYNYDSSMGLYPFEIFERAWIMDNLVLADIPLKSHLKNLMIYLKENWTDDGISMSVTYPSKDLDDTAVVFKLLNKNNTKLNPSIFSQYFIEDHFKCYYTERNPSVIVQMRVMDAIKDLNDLENKEHYIEAVLDFLERNQFKDGYWKDKWNISPYNTTSNAIRALDNYDRKLTDKAVDWFMNTQNTDGSWGVLNGNSEETAYAVQALIYYHKNVEKIDIERVEPGIKYILENYTNENYPELWIGKGLYAPRNIVKSAIISALYMYHSQIQPLKQLA